MSVERVTLSPSDENSSPPTHEIEVAVIGNDVLITIYDGSLDDLNVGRKKAYDVPPLAYHDLVAALTAFGDIVQGFRFPRSPAAAGRTATGEGE